MSGDVFVLNCGSSSIKFSLFGGRHDLVELGRGKIEGIGGGRGRLRAFDRDGELLVDQMVEGADGKALSHHHALEALVEWGEDREAASHIAAVGHRVVHGGTDFSEPVRIDAHVMEQLTALIPLAPLHQPHNLNAINAVTRLRPDLPQVACFDTAFHRSQPRVEQTYALPREITKAGVHRYGFHGLSYEYMANVLPGVVGESVAAGRVVVAHLGNGASMCALRDGESIATTMGFTSLDGLPMGTRSGNVDPGVALYLIREWDMSAEEVAAMLYNRSGLLGVSGISNDMRELLASDDPRAAEAIDLFTYRIVRELGSLAAALGGLDALVFTAGIGERAAPVRARVCKGAAWMGVHLDEAANQRDGPCITTAGSPVSVWVIPTNEELMIARHAQALLT